MIASLVDLSQVGPLLVFGLIYVIVYVGGMWRLGLNDYERELVKSPALRVLRGRRGDLSQ